MKCWFDDRLINKWTMPCSRGFTVWVVITENRTPYSNNGTVFSLGLCLAELFEKAMKKNTRNKRVIFDVAALNKIPQQWGGYSLVYCIAQDGMMISQWDICSKRCWNKQSEFNLQATLNLANSTSLSWILVLEKPLLKSRSRTRLSKNNLAPPWEGSCCDPVDPKESRNRFEGKNSNYI